MLCAQGVPRLEFHLPAFASIKARLAHLGIAPGSFACAPKEKDAGPTAFLFMLLGGYHHGFAAPLSRCRRRAAVCTE